MLQPLPMATSTWPIAGDAPDLLAIVQAQAVVIHDNMQLVDAYQAVLDAAQAAPPPLPTATGNGTAGASPNQNQLTVTSAVSTIVVGAVVAGAGIPTATTILNQVSGSTGGNGVYTTSVGTTASASALTFAPPPLPSTWPPVSAATDLNAVLQDQTSIIRTQTALLQQYQDLLNASETAAPPTGP